MKAIRSWRRVLLWVGAAFVLFIAVLAGAAWYLSKRVEPFIRESTIAYLRGRFDGDVEMKSLRVSMPIKDPIGVLLKKGDGAHVRVKAGNILLRHKGRHDIPPLLTIKQLQFQMDLSTIWNTPVRVQHIKIDGFELTIPPAGQRPSLGSTTPAEKSAEETSKTSVIIDHVELDGMKLVVLPRDPEKEPLEFEMLKLRLESAGPGVPMRYETVMNNAKPPGLIKCSGSFGPYMATDPGESPITGDYAFTGADLGVFKPIAGTLASNGKFKGKLNEIIVDGQANVPDFRLKMAGNPLPLRTKFHAVVDGTNGNTLLQPVEATLGRSRMICRGGIARHKDESKKTVSFTSR